MQVTGNLSSLFQTEGQSFVDPLGVGKQAVDEMLDT